MFVETLKYTDFDGVERTETFRFNLTEAELLSMELTADGSYTKYLQKIIDANDKSELVKVFQKIIDASYGIKSDDGRRFIKSESVLEEFKQTQAYSEFYTRLMTDPDYASKFVNGTMPQKLVQQIAAQQAAQKPNLEALPTA